MSSEWSPQVRGVFTRPRITCSKVAHVHHDATKMAAYEAAHASCERFFSDPAFANEWLLLD